MDPFLSDHNKQSYIIGTIKPVKLKFNRKS